MGLKWQPRRGGDAKDTHEAVHSSVNLVVDAAALALAEFHGGVNETLVRGLVGRREDERGVGGRILGLVDIDSCKDGKYQICPFLWGYSSTKSSLTLEITRI